jgi:hypothetical protein
MTEGTEYCQGWIGIGRGFRNKGQSCTGRRRYSLAVPLRGSSLRSRYLLWCRNGRPSSFRSGPCAGIHLTLCCTCPECRRFRRRSSEARWRRGPWRYRRRPACTGLRHHRLERSLGSSRCPIPRDSPCKYRPRCTGFDRRIRSLATRKCRDTVPLRCRTPTPCRHCRRCRLSRGQATFRYKPTGYLRCRHHSPSMDWRRHKPFPQAGG